MALYTESELITKIKDIDTQLEQGYSETDLDSGQSRTRWKRDMKVLLQMRENYMIMLQQDYPSSVAVSAPPFIYGSSEWRP